MLALIEDQAQSLYMEGIRLNNEIQQLDERIGEMQELIDTFTTRLNQLRKRTEADVVRRDKMARSYFFDSSSQVLLTALCCLSIVVR